MHWERQFLIYVGMKTNTREYEDIAFRSWEYIHTYIHTCIDFIKNVDGTNIVIQKWHVCNDIHVDVCFKIEKGEMNIHQNTQQHQNTKHAARKTQIDRQAGKKKHIHTTQTHEDRQTEKECA